MSLIEVMMAMLVLLIVSLAVMQTALVGMDSNMKNILRDEAVRLAEERMELARTNAGPGSPPPVYVPRKVRNVNVKFQGVDGYKVTTAVNTVGVDMDRIDMTVEWTWKGDNYKHTISSLR